jgi:hypothetical protein
MLSSLVVRRPPRKGPAYFYLTLSGSIVVMGVAAASQAGHPRLGYGHQASSPPLQLVAQAEPAVRFPPAAGQVSGRRGR